jgi:zinc transport system permease protein
VGIAHTRTAASARYLLGFEPIVGAFAFSCSRRSGCRISRKGGAPHDVVIALFGRSAWRWGFTFRVHEGYPPDLSSYLSQHTVRHPHGPLLMLALTAVLRFDRRL